MAIGDLNHKSMTFDCTRLLQRSFIEGKSLTMKIELFNLGIQKGVVFLLLSLEKNYSKQASKKFSGSYKIVTTG
jgi:hypothetical protein